MATLPTKITTLEPDVELQTEIMAVAMILNERRPGYQRFGTQRQLQLHQAALDLRSIADRIDEGLALQQRVAEKLMSGNSEASPVTAPLDSEPFQAAQLRALNGDSEVV
jgi:hypothetical protein